jgi:hypothetical protein
LRSEKKELAKATYNAMAEAHSHSLFVSGVQPIKTHSMMAAGRVAVAINDVGQCPSVIIAHDSYG